jgi:hypothetical protein
MVWVPPVLVRWLTWTAAPVRRATSMTSASASALEPGGWGELYRTWKKQTWPVSAATWARARISARSTPGLYSGEKLMPANPATCSSRNRSARRPIWASVAAAPTGIPNGGDERTK